TWTIDGGHNWQTHKWMDVNTNLLLKPDNTFYWNLRTGWDIEETRYKDLISSLTYAPYNYYNTKFSVVTDMNEGRVKSGSILHDLYLLEGQPNQWHIKLNQVFDSATDEFKLRDIMIVKDIHCWELKYSYSDFRKEFSLTFGLKAMPDDPFGLSSGKGFYYEGLEREMKDLKKEGSLQRY
ncbi:MAG: hypothetical protein KKA31_02480, partial [Candidatus Margulisbacteria bacterium]|nr:hypothetical protein [Candidatus Margulisiibacteriota bacterium]